MKKNEIILKQEETLKINQVSSEKLVDLFKIFICLEQICVEKGLESLSACQIGIPLSAFVIFRNQKFEYFFNCSYDGIGDKITSIEECCSVVDAFGKYKTFEVSRFLEIDIYGKMLDISRSPSDDGFVVTDINFRASGKQSILIQHEIDHCEGIFISSIGKEINLF